MTNWTTIKKDFKIDALLDIFALIFEYKDRGYYESDKEMTNYNVFEYATVLMHTKLQTDMFIGDKAIFKGFRRKPSTGLIEHVFSNGRVTLHSYKLYVDIYVTNGNEITYNKMITTLSQFAEFTKENPIELC